ncbi:unnamed protein product [Cladocopium goreaui]|uniref:Uncharacterized protein n=1 Tax=Cladocopium goreaui TaxID=2562237 RepID=A0A9P1CCA4_9DINO|nr:unnamed protein product [Cladocopium goreaui]
MGKCEGLAVFFASEQLVCVPVKTARSLGIEIFEHIDEPTGPCTRCARFAFIRIFSTKHLCISAAMATGSVAGNSPQKASRKKREMTPVPFQAPAAKLLKIHEASNAQNSAWADFLKDQNLDEAKLLKSYQIVPRVAPSPTFRKGLYLVVGGGELGAIQAPTLLENYLVGRLEAPTFAATTVVWAAPLLRNNEVYRDWCGPESGGASVEGMYKGMKWVGGRGGVLGGAVDQREVLAKEGKESQLVGQKGEGRQAAATFSKGKQEEEEDDDDDDDDDEENGEDEEEEEDDDENGYEDTNLPDFSLTMSACELSSMTVRDLPPPSRPLKLKLKVASPDSAASELHVRTCSLRHSLADCGFPVGGGYLDADDNLVEKGPGANYVRWTEALPFQHVSKIADIIENTLWRLRLVLEPGIVRVMHEAGVNVDVLAEMLDLVWEDAAKSTQKITFTELVNMVLGMRGSNPATVKDCKEQIRVTNSLIKRCFMELYDELDEKVQQIRTEIQNSLDNDLDFEGDFSWDGEHTPKDGDETEAVDEEEPDDQDPDARIRGQVRGAVNHGADFPIVSVFAPMGEGFYDAACPEDAMLELPPQPLPVPNMANMASMANIGVSAARRPGRQWVVAEERHPDETVKGEEFMSSESLLGKWVDSQGHSIHVLSADAYNVRLLATLSKTMCPDKHLALKPVRLGAGWQCGHSILDPSWSTSSQLHWVAGDGRVTVWVRPSKAKKAEPKEKDQS